MNKLLRSSSPQQKLAIYSGTLMMPSEVASGAKPTTGAKKRKLLAPQPTAVPAPPDHGLQVSQLPYTPKGFGLVFDGAPSIRFGGMIVVPKTFIERIAAATARNPFRMVLPHNVIPLWRPGQGSPS